MVAHANKIITALNSRDHRQRVPRGEPQQPPLDSLVELVEDIRDDLGVPRLLQGDTQQPHATFRRQSIQGGRQSPRQILARIRLPGAQIKANHNLLLGVFVVCGSRRLSQIQGKDRVGPELDGPIPTIDVGQEIP